MQTLRQDQTGQRGLPYLCRFPVGLKPSSPTSRSDIRRLRERGAVKPLSGLGLRTDTEADELGPGGRDSKTEPPLCPLCLRNLPDTPPEVGTVDVPRRPGGPKRGDGTGRHRGPVRGGWVGLRPSAPRGRRGYREAQWRVRKGTSKHRTRRKRQ